MSGWLQVTLADGTKNLLNMDNFDVVEPFHETAFTQPEDLTGWSAGTTRRANRPYWTRISPTKVTLVKFLHPTDEFHRGSERIVIHSTMEEIHVRIGGGYVLS